MKDLEPNERIQLWVRLLCMATVGLFAANPETALFAPAAFATITTSALTAIWLTQKRFPGATAT